MKKFLSLVLALVMTMSLVTVSAGAKDFTDSDKIQYAEAVDVMSAVKVIDGYAEGDFRPSTTLTRGAAAKIICNLILGPTAASALVADAAPYKDVPTNHTFAGYIAYCQKEGIISGYADGTFRPANSLTGYAFMKMLLGALGYDGAVEGYTGPNWSINVAKRALNIGLADDLVGSFNGVKAVTREEACLYALNTMTADMVEYDSKTSVTAGTTTVVVTGSKAKEMEAVNSKTDGNVFDADKIVQFAEKYFTDLKVRKDADDFGRPANTWRLKSNDIGTYTNTPDATFTKKVSKADLYSTVGKSVYDDLKDGKAKLTAYFDGDPESVKSTDIDSKWVNKTDTGKVNSTGNGDLTEVYVDDDNNVTLVTVRTYVFQAATDYDAKKESVNLAQDGNKFDNRTKDSSVVITLQDRTVEAEDYAVVKDLKADDYVLVTAVKNSKGNYDVKSVEKAEVKTVEVAGYKENDSITAGSETYSYAATTMKSSEVAANTTDGIKSTKYTVGKQATLVFDKYGYIIAVDEAVVLSDYVFISEFGHTSSLNSKAVANAIFPDGTDAEITVKEVLGNKNKSSISGMGVVNQWYTFSKNAANEYTLYAIESKNEQIANTYGGLNTVVTTNGKVNPIQDGTAAAVTNRPAPVGKTMSTVLADDKTVVVVSDKDDNLSVYTGVKNFPGVKLTSATSAALVSAVYKTSSNYATLVYIDVDGTATITGDKNSNLVYVVEYDGKYVTKDNETFYKYTVLDENGEKVKVEADNQIQGQTGKVYKVANYLTKNGDRLTDFQLVNTDRDVVVYGSSTMAAAPIKESTGTLVMAPGTGNNTGKFIVTNDTKITLVTTKGANVLNKDADADFEVATNMSAKELVNALSAANSYTYTYAGKTTDSDNEILKELYVTVTAATLPTVPGGGVDHSSGEGSIVVSYTVASNGRLRYTVDYTAPDYAAGNATVNIDVYADGKYYDSLTPINKALKDGGFVETNTDFGYPDDQALTFKIDSESFTQAKVKYVDQNGKTLDVSKLTLADGTTKATETVGVASTATIKFNYKSNDTTANAIDYQVTTGTDKTETAGTATAKADTTVNTTGSVTGKDFVTVKLDVSKLKDLCAITVAPAAAEAIKTGAAYTGSFLDKDNDTVVLTSSRTNAPKGEKTNITATLAIQTVANFTNTEAVNVTLYQTGADGVKSEVDTQIVKGDGSTSSYPVNFNNIKIEGDVKFTVEITDCAAPKLVSTTVIFKDEDNGGALNVNDTFTLTFDQELSVAPALTSADTGKFNVDGGTLSGDNKTVTYKITALSLIAGDKVKVELKANAATGKNTGVKGPAADKLIITVTPDTTYGVNYEIK